MKIKVLLLLISIPILAELSMFVVGLLGLILVNIIYFPISWLGDLSLSAIVKLAAIQAYMGAA